ncbi:unnamed protein product [Darwinula stevensoni]|uniref:C-type lectin domain-containing protein n=1 Tax=Darwinula stevensoni TaxID=69355 RepID=A0A7R9AHS3_9CRUS|nr:unnamed protein product [Darwinula stevensoni]CAG0904727.1 unnamed protein product [Darwinula stevensoni]
MDTRILLLLCLVTDSFAAKILDKVAEEVHLKKKEITEEETAPHAYPDKYPTEDSLDYEKKYKEYRDNLPKRPDGNQSAQRPAVKKTRPVPSQNIPPYGPLGQVKLLKPQKEACLERPIHERFGGQNYYFSWRDDKFNRLLKWVDGRNFCRRMCMELVALDTRSKEEFIKAQISEDHKFGLVNDTWTSGRLCDFKGCERSDRLTGWYWASSSVPIPPKGKGFTDWGAAGTRGPQPDNANAPEDCIALVEPEANGEPSGKYSWHDLPCVYENDIVCEDDESLLAYAKKKFKIVALESAATLVTGNNKTVYEPVKRLGVVYSGMNSALKTREDAIAEYQKLNAKIGKLQRLERTGNNVVKQHQYQREANALEQELRERTRHLNGELPQVYGHRVEYFQPCLQAHIFSQVEYYGELVKLFAELVSEEVKGVPGDASKDLLEKVKALSIVA